MKSAWKGPKIGFIDAQEAGGVVKGHIHIEPKSVEVVLKLGWGFDNLK